MYLIPVTTAFPWITGNREEIERKCNGENIATLNDVGIYNVSIYKNTWKNECKKNVFCLLQIGFNVEEEGWSVYFWK